MGMDYGKTAYLKVEDLERRLDAVVSMPKMRNAYTSVCPRFRLNENGGFDAVRLKGDGSMTLIARISVVTQSGGKIELYVDGAKAGSVEVFVGKSVEIVMNNVNVIDGGRLSFSASNGFDGIIEAVDITLIGTNADFDKTVFDWATASDDEFSVILTNEDGSLSLRSRSGGGYPDLETEPVFLAKAIRADATILNGVCYIAYSDASSNLWGCSMANGQEVSDKVRLYEGASSVALAPYSGGLLFVVIEKGALKCFTTDCEFNLTSLPAYVDTAIKATSVLLVKNQSEPSLVYFNGFKSYLKTLERETVSSSIIGVAIEFEVAQNS